LAKQTHWIVGITSFSVFHQTTVVKIDMFLHAGLWKSSTGCHIGEIQRPERWLQMHREDEWQMVSQHKQLSPLCFWSGDVSGVLKWKFGLLAFVSLTSLYYVFIHWFSSEMLWKISPPFRIDFSLKSFAIRIKIRVTLVIVRVCLRKTGGLYIKEFWAGNIRAPGLICSDGFCSLFLTLQVWWAANPC
jgi:hypothetical protein